MFIPRKIVPIAVAFLLVECLPACAGGPLTVSVLVKLLEQADVPAREAGELIAIETAEGARVKAGDVLAQIDDTEARFLEKLALVEAEIAARNAENDVAVLTAEKIFEVAKAEYQRANEAAKRLPGSIPKSDLDQYRLDYEKAELLKQQAEHDRQVARSTHRLKQTEHEFASRGVDRRKIKAPFDGVVVEVDRRRGEWVEPGEKVLRIVRLDRLRAEGFLDQRAAHSGLEGSPVRLQVEGSERSSVRFEGKVVFVSPEVDPVNGQVRILANIDNPDLTLRPGQRATMTISVSTRRE